MKTIVSIPLFLIFFQGYLAGAAEQCRSYFSDHNILPGGGQSKYLEITKADTVNYPSSVRLVQQELSRTGEDGVLDLVRLLLNNRDVALDEKNVFLKGELEIGIPFNGDHTLILSYKSSSIHSSSFVLDDKVLLIANTPKLNENGQLEPSEYSLSKAKFILPEYFEKDLSVGIKIPLRIDAPILNQLKNYAKYFEHLTKDELRVIFENKSSFKRKYLLKVGRAKSMLKEALLKSPFKSIANGIMTGLIIGGSNYFLTAPGPIKDPFINVVSAPAAQLGRTKSSVMNPAEEKLAQAQYSALKIEAQKRYAQDPKLAKPNTTEFIDSSVHNSGSLAFSSEMNSWIMTKADPINGSTHTYVVFSEEVPNSRAIQYFIMEINPIKYAALVKKLKNPFN